jgi:hypothetical protein
MMISKKQLRKLALRFWRQYHSGHRINPEYFFGDRIIWYINIFFFVKPKFPIMKKVITLLALIAFFFYSLLGE